MDKQQGWLANNVFETIVTNTPLISIDLLVENEQGEFLLGLRKNRPAQGYWFVPGGRVLKNESLDQAFKRLTKLELGLELERNQVDFKGVYEHFYQNSVFDEHSSTHYIVLAHKVKLLSRSVKLDENQHSDYQWVDPGELSKVKVHKYTIDYFT